MLASLVHRVWLTWFFRVWPKGVRKDLGFLETCSCRRHRYRAPAWLNAPHQGGLQGPDQAGADRGANTAECKRKTNFAKDAPQQGGPFQHLHHPTTSKQHIAKDALRQSGPNFSL